MVACAAMFSAASAIGSFACATSDFPKQSVAQEVRVAVAINSVACAGLFSAACAGCVFACADLFSAACAKSLIACANSSSLKQSVLQQLEVAYAIMAFACATPLFGILEECNLMTLTHAAMTPACATLRPAETLFHSCSSNFLASKIG